MQNCLKQYIEFIAGKRMHVPKLDPHLILVQILILTQKWISGGEVQVASQETEISSYVIGGTKQDVDKDSFKGFSL